MIIKSIKIEGVKGEITISRTELGAIAAAPGCEVVAEFRRGDEGDARRQPLLKLAMAICGASKRQVNMTNSELYTLGEMVARVAD